MQLSPRQQKIIFRIDRQVSAIVTAGEGDQQIGEAILTLMPEHMTGFKHLLDTLSPHEMEQVCQRYSGFYHFAKMMERVAQGRAAGIFDDLIAR
jgi:hypothetical protein